MRKFRAAGSAAHHPARALPQPECPPAPHGCSRWPARPARPMRAECTACGDGIHAPLGPPSGHAGSPSPNSCHVGWAKPCGSVFFGFLPAFFFFLQHCGLSPSCRSLGALHTAVASAAFAHLFVGSHSLPHVDCWACHPSSLTAACQRRAHRGWRTFSQTQLCPWGACEVAICSCARACARGFPPHALLGSRAKQETRVLQFRPWSDQTPDLLDWG